jgi:hypothetical protein
MHLCYLHCCQMCQHSCVACADKRPVEGQLVHFCWHDATRTNGGAMQGVQIKSAAQTCILFTTSRVKTSSTSCVTGVTAEHTQVLSV